MTGLIILLAVVLVILFWGVDAYKRLVSLQNQVKNAFSQIDGQLKRRHDLIPNLVETAKACLEHEGETLAAVIAARNQALGAHAKAVAAPGDAVAMQGMAAAEGMLSSTLDTMFALSESYPALKANENMMQIAEELASTENRIVFACQAYNDGVVQYNTSREQFPGSLIAGLFAFKQAALLQSAESPQERKPGRVFF